MDLLTIKNLKIHYQLKNGVFKAVDGVDLEVKKGQTIGLVGESGCGKSTLVKGIMQVMSKNAFFADGDIEYNGESMLAMSESKRRGILWKEISMIPQASMDSMNPVYPVVDAFVEIMTLKGGKSKKEAILRAEELFELVGIDKSRIKDYPHQFSGGMKQRVAIALALCLDPKIIIADEPVTALDVIVQHQVLTMLNRLKNELDLTIILITHDISVVAQTCDDLAVMYAGKIAEKGSVLEVLRDPKHPYSMGLSNAFPDLLKNEKLISIEGSVPDLAHNIEGCRFVSRCPFAIDQCHTLEPVVTEYENNRSAACHRAPEYRDLQQLAEEASVWNKVTTT
ncbi:ABC transporter ATP-binding protein [Virgibacillus byunsanensis]|uniref:ABC transporter ATP-binding protein n=1 Tax=Virgibacillus byunsanensis TaxID=570945 RepID=A0ABW3LJ61_9BACI